MPKNITPAMAAKLTLLGNIEGNVEFLQREKRILHAKLEKLESEMIGAKEAMRQLREEIRVMGNQQVFEEITHREVDIARIKGKTLILGEELTREIKVMLGKPIEG